MISRLKQIKCSSRTHHSIFHNNTIWIIDTWNRISRNGIKYTCQDNSCSDSISIVTEVDRTVELFVDISHGVTGDSGIDISISSYDAGYAVMIIAHIYIKGRGDYVCSVLKQLIVIYSGLYLSGNNDSASTIDRQVSYIPEIIPTA